MAILQVPCFRYLGKDCTAPLTVEQGAGNEMLVRCPVRQRLYRLTPEERVRQALLWFLTEGGNRAAVLAEYLRLGVEESSLDVAGFFAGDAIDQRFCPNVTVVILETKRQERDLTDDVEQLKIYMLRQRCRAGLLFNGRQAVWLSLGGAFVQPVWTTECLTDLCEVEERVERVSVEANTHFVECRRTFTAAAGGDFDSLLCLAALFAGDSSLTFMLSIRARGSLGSVQGFGLRALDPNLITYRTRGVVSRHRQQLTRQDFHALVAVRPL